MRCVIHYQLPASVDTYVHRSGRTGRWGAEGLNVALVSPKDSARFMALLRALDRDAPPEFPVDPTLLPEARERVRLAIRCDEVARKQSKTKATRTWAIRQAEELELDLSESDIELMHGKKATKGRRGNVREQRGEGEEVVLEKIQQELANRLAQPLQARYSPKYFTGGQATGGVSGAAAGHQPGQGKGGGGEEDEENGPQAEAPQGAGSSPAQGDGRGECGGEEEGEGAAGGHPLCVWQAGGGA